MRRTAYLLSAWTLVLAACGPAAAPAPTAAPAAPAATVPDRRPPKPTTAPAAAATTAAAAAAPRRRRSRADDRAAAAAAKPRGWRTRRGRHAQDPVLAGADHPQHAPVAGHQGLRRGAPGPRAARRHRARWQAHRAARGRGPDHRQRRRLQGPEDGHLEAQAGHQVVRRQRLHRRRRGLHLQYCADPKTACDRLGERRGRRQASRPRIRRPPWSPGRSRTRIRTSCSLGIRATSSRRSSSRTSWARRPRTPRAT